MTNTRKTYLNDCVYNGHVRRWNKDTLLIFIAPCEDPQYSEMVKTAYQLWLAETNHTLKVEYVEDLYESDINVSWIELTNENLGNCQFDYDNNGQFIGAEVSVPLPNYNVNPKFNDNEVFYTILKLTGYSLGLPSSPYEDDITHETHQYGVIPELSERDKLSMKWLYRIKQDDSVADLAKMLYLDENTSLDDFIAFFEKGASYAKENAEENDEKKESKNSSFDIDDFVSSMTSQAKDLVPSDVSQVTSDYIISTMDSFLRMAYEAISNDNELNPTENDYILLLQILAEWIFHKSVDISRSKVPFVHWDTIMQRIAFCIFEIVKQAWIRDIAKDVIVDAVAHHVDKCYKERLKELFDNKKITKEIFEAAIAESNIDKMADEIKKESNIKNALGYDSVDEMMKEQADKKWDEIKKKNKEQLEKEQKRIKEAIKNDEKLDDDVTSINDAMEVAEKYFEQEKKVNDEHEKLKKIRKEYEKKTNKAIDSMIPENMKKTMQKQEESKFGKLFSKHVLGNSVEIFLGFLVICLNSKINLSILSFVGVLLFLYNHFSSSIAEFIIKYDFSLSTVNFIVYFVSILIIGKIIVSSIMKAINDDIQRQLKEVEETRQKMQDLVNPNKQFERLGVDIIDIQVGHKLPCIADPNRGGTLLAKTDVLRQELTDKLGYIIPNIRIRDCASLDLNEYSILIRGNVVASGFVYPNKYMVLADEWDSKVGKVPENVIYGVDPALGTQCYWLNKEDVENHWDNITVVDPVGVIKTHLEVIVIKYVDSILTGTDIKKYLMLVDSQEETLMETILQRIELDDIRRIFASLIREQVSIKDIIFVRTRLNYYSKTIKDPIELTEMLRRDLAQQISMKHADKDRNLWVVELDENYTKYLESNVKNTIKGQIFDIPQEQINELIEMTATKLMIVHQSIGIQPVVLCSPKFRQALYNILVKYISTVVVMSYAEVVQTVKVVTEEIIEYKEGAV